MSLLEHIGMSIVLLVMLAIVSGTIFGCLFLAFLISESQGMAVGLGWLFLVAVFLMSTIGYASDRKPY